MAGKGAETYAEELCVLATAGDNRLPVHSPGGKIGPDEHERSLHEAALGSQSAGAVHADGGIREGESVNGNILNKLRNLNVKFCNADGSICINYLDTLNKYPDSKYNVSDTNLPAYISARDTDGDGNSDSLYIVFDPRFGGPVEVFKIQPVVAKVEPHTLACEVEPLELKISLTVLIA